MHRYCVLVVGLFALLQGTDSEVFGNDKVKFIFYSNRAAPESEPWEFKVNDEKSFDFQDFVSTEQTVIIIHGFGGSYKNGLPQTLKNASLATSNANVILVDYEAINAPYASLYANAVSIGETIGTLINKLVAVKKVDSTRLRIVGHSFGAHIAGFAANHVNGLVLHIVGLDPAGPLFREVPENLRLSRGDAIFVDCIHTSPWLGINEPICDVNYFPNGGQNQPGCAMSGDAEIVYGSCSHLAAVYYYADSLRNSKAYRANLCFNADAAKQGKSGPLCMASTNRYMDLSVTNRNPLGSYNVIIPSKD